MTTSGKILPADSPVRYGCFAAILIGAALTLLGGYQLVFDAGPMPLRIALVLFGAATTTLGYIALWGSRVGWAFVTAICGTETVGLLFGAPSIRNAADIPLWAAALPSLAFAITTVLLSLNKEATGQAHSHPDQSDMPGKK